jgi:hypothetical protein
MIDELSARSLLSNVVSLSRGGTFSGKTRKSFLEIGRMSEESLDNSLRHIKARMDSGEDLYAAVRTLDPKLRDELGTAIRSVHNSNIGRAYFGELPAFSNKAMGKMFLKLQSFALTAYEKGIQRGLRNDQAGFIAATAWSAGIAYMWQRLMFVFNHLRCQRINGTSMSPRGWMTSAFTLLQVVCHSWLLSVQWRRFTM